MKSKKMVSMILATLAIAGGAMSVQAISADDVQENLEKEISIRNLMDVNLQNQINNKAEASNVYTKNEVDTKLDSKVDTSAFDTTVEGLADRITAEATARDDADKALDGKISAEATARADADLELKDKINTEAEARGKADQELQKNIDAEAAARADMDLALKENIETEQKSRESADEVLKETIDAETANRVEADNALNSRISHVETDANKGIAKASALAALHPLDYDPDNKFDVAAAGGFYKGEKAFALGAFYRPNRNMMVSLATSLSSGDNAYNVGVTFKIGKAGKRAETGVSTSELYAMIGAMQEKMDQQQKRIEELEANQAK